MLVNSPCCPTCRKRISSLQMPYKRMATKQLTYEDACRVILYIKPSVFGIGENKTWDELNLALKDILENDYDEDVLNEIEKAKSFDLDVPTIHSILGVIRPCCKKLLNDPPIAPIFATKQPKDSSRIMDKGIVKRLLLRQGNGYKLDNYTGDD